jgi:hypothetical protein
MNHGMSHHQFGSLLALIFIGGPALLIAGKLFLDAVWPPTLTPPPAPPEGETT